MFNNYLGVLKQSATGFSAALSVFIAGCWLGWPSPAIKKLFEGEVNLKITADEISWVVALMDLGNIFSPIPSGYLADYLGRKTTLLLTAFLYITTWALVIFGDSVWYLYIARIGAGMGKGVAFTVVPMYLGEIAGVQVRGAVSTMFTGLLSGGILFEYCIGPFVTYTWLNIISGLVPIVFFCTFFLLPESPYYFLMKNRVQDAKASLEWFRSKEIKNDEVINEELEDMRKTVDQEMKEKGRFIDVVTTVGNRKALIIVTFLSAFQRFGGISPMLAYTAVTLPTQGGYFKPDLYMIIFGITLVLGNFLSAPLTDSWGRKPLLIFSNSACAIFTGLSTLFFWAAGPNNDLEGLNWTPYLCFVGYGISFSFGISIPSTLVGELFPTNVKSYAASIGSISFAVSSFAVNKFYLFVKDNYGTQYMYGFFTVCSLITVIFSITMVFETKGKKFSEIQHELIDNS